MVILRDKNQTVLPEPLTDDEMSWILSISSLVDLVAFSFCGYLADNLGRKYSIILACMPRIIMCILFIFSTRVWMLMLGRAISGLSDAAINRIQTYIIVITCIPLLLLPESPYFLYSKGHSDEAVKLLISLRGSETLAWEEISEYGKTNHKVNKLELLKDKKVLKTIAKVMFLAMCMQMTGNTYITYHLQTIFELTNTSVSSAISSLIIGFITVFASCCTIYLSDRFGRKPVLRTSLIGQAIGMVGLGTFFKLTQASYEITGFLNYLPLISMIISIYCYSAGVFIACFFGFLTIRYLTALMHVIGIAPTYWMFGGFCFLTCAFCFAGYLADKIGRKYSLIIACLPRIITSFIFIYASQVWMFLLGRGICGISDAFTVHITATYTSEIASKGIRGGLGTISQIWSSLGGMIILITGPYVSYDTINIIHTSIVIGTGIPLLFLPESPYFLYSIGRSDESLKLLISLRGSETVAKEEIKEYSINNDHGIRVNKIELLKEKNALKTVGKVMFLGMGYMLTGYTSASFHLQTIFEMTHTSVSSEISSAIIGVIAVQQRNKH
ncbi:Sugar transporter 11 [Operophtera brumata]|uniref:Sugar transporter 11 n=1 Tax=Operophtera brumata TaxID=104452 RepID=A0A0L7LFN9_OPEBR|nr:Sugar transporter 11 [Operophtera brumata]